MPVSLLAVTVGFVLACWAIDVRTRHIPNPLTAGAFVAGILLNTFHFGSAGLTHALLGTIAGAGLLVAPFALGGIGGGDVKMMGAAGALTGVKIVLVGLAAGLVLGGVIMAVHLVRIGRLREKLASTGRMVSSAATTGSTAPLRLSDEAPDAVTLPYSVPLGIGLLGAVALYGGWT